MSQFTFTERVFMFCCSIIISGTMLPTAFMVAQLAYELFFTAITGRKP